MSSSLLYRNTRPTSSPSWQADMPRSFAALLAGAGQALGGTGEARLEAEILLAHACDCPRTHFRTWPEKMPAAAQLARFNAYLAERQNGEPLAYILGERGFWTLNLQVTPGVLIPRSDTERLVESVLADHGSGALTLADLGTGSGAIALALASERPHWTVLACDTSPAALTCARSNRQSSGLDNVRVLESDWCAALQTGVFDVIVSNPPYIADSDRHLEQGDLPAEPREALAAGPDGLRDIRRIVDEARRPLRAGGCLYLEHGYDQGERVRAILAAQGYIEIRTDRDLAGHERVTRARLQTEPVTTGNPS